MTHKNYTVITITLSMFCFLFHCDTMVNVERYSPWDETTFNKYVIQQKKTAIIKFYKSYSSYDWENADLTLASVEAHYNGKISTGKFDWSTNLEFRDNYVKNGERSFVIFHKGQVVRSFNNVQEYWYFCEIIDSLLSIPKPDSLPELEITWNRLAESLPFEMMPGSDAVVFNNKIRILYGKDSTIYSTCDGINWVNCEPGIIAKQPSALFVDTNCIWGIRPNLYSNTYPTLFSLSFAGDSAICSTIAKPISGLKNCSSIQMIRTGDTLRTVGGWSNSEGEYAPDYKIKIGDTNWIKLSTSHKRGHVIINFRNSYWLTGGWYNNETQYLTLEFSNYGMYNRSKWTSYGFTSRANHAAVVLDDIAILLAGQGGEYGELYLNDAFFTKDCIDWYRVKQVTPFSPRRLPACVYFKGKLWLFGGYNGETFLNDLWIGEITARKNIFF